MGSDVPWNLQRGISFRSSLDRSLVFSESSGFQVLSCYLLTVIHAKVIVFNIEVDVRQDKLEDSIKIAKEIKIISSCFFLPVFSSSRERARKNKGYSIQEVERGKRRGKKLCPPVAVSFSSE